MFDKGSRSNITEWMAESADSKTESANSTPDSSPNLARIGVWVRAFKVRCSKGLGIVNAMRVQGQ